MAGRSVLAPFVALATGLITGTVVTAVPAVAAPPPGAVRSVPLPSLSGQLVRDAEFVAPTLYVAAANEVHRFRMDGTDLGSITGQFGATDLVPTSDRSRMFVARSTGSGIGVVNLADGTATSWLPDTACVRHLAVTTSRLYFVSGCSSPYALQSVSVTNGSDLRTHEASSFFSYDLRANGSRLITATDSSPSTVTSYTVAANGDLTSTGSVRVGEGYDFTLSPDGTYLLATGYDHGYSLDRYTTATLSAAGSYPAVPYPNATAYSADGSKVALGLGGPYGPDFNVWDASTGSLLATAPGGFETTPRPSVVAHTLGFSPDGSTVYGITTDWGGTGQFFLTSTPTAPPVPGTVALSVPRSVTFGKAVPVTVTSRPGAPVRVELTPSGAGTKTVTGVTNAKGVFSTAFWVSASGTVRATVDADAGHTLAQTSASYSVAGVVGVSMSGHYKVVRGVRYYKPKATIRALVTALPARSTNVRATLQYLDKKGWHNGSSAVFGTDARGQLQLFIRIPKGITYRVVAQSLADNGHTASVVVAGPLFRIG